jgi:hypothetical protein
LDGIKFFTIFRNFFRGRPVVIVATGSSQQRWLTRRSCFFYSSILCFHSLQI